jgi:hypothetical protein
MMQNFSVKRPKVTLTVSCPLDLYEWLKRTRRNVSGYVVEAIESMKTAQNDEGVEHHGNN